MKIRQRNQRRARQIVRAEGGRGWSLVIRAWHLAGMSGHQQHGNGDVQVVFRSGTVGLDEESVHIGPSGSSLMDTGWCKPLASGLWRNIGMSKGYSRQTDCHHHSVELFDFMIS